MICFTDYRWQFAGASSPALHDLNLTIEPGETILLTGNSGSGKSTLGLALAGLLHHNHPGDVTGTIEIGGEDVTKALPQSLAGKIALVGQNPQLSFATMTVEQELAFTLENLCQSPLLIETKMSATLKQFAIIHLRDRDLNTLSFGQEQRVAIGAALIAEPDVLFLDEPSAGLDPEGIETLLRLLQTVKKDRNFTLIIAEHNRHLFRSLKARQIHLHNGTITEKRSRPSLFHTQLKPIDTDIARPLVDIYKLTVKRSDTHVLNNINTQFFPGEIIGLMGPNGSGKSSLLLSLMGLLPLTKGYVHIGPYDVTPTGVSELAEHVGFVFQNPDHQLFCDSVQEEALFASKNLAKDLPKATERVQTWLTDAGIYARRSDHPYRLSFGQKRRLNLISAALHDIHLLLLDEPFIGQDPHHINWLLQTIHRLAEQGVTVLIVAHDPHLVQACCHRVLFLDAGQLRIDLPTSQAWPMLQKLGYTAYTPNHGGGL